MNQARPALGCGLCLEELPVEFVPGGRRDPEQGLASLDALELLHQQLNAAGKHRAVLTPR